MMKTMTQMDEVRVAFQGGMFKKMEILVFDINNVKGRSVVGAHLGNLNRQTCHYPRQARPRGCSRRLFTLSDNISALETLRHS